MEESRSYKDNDRRDKCKIVVIIMIILVTLLMLITENVLT